MNALKQIGRQSILFAVLLFILAGGTAHAAKNPLNTIPAESFDFKTSGIQMEKCSEGGSNLCSVHSGNYVVYKAFDFDSGVAALKARIASVRQGTIEIRLDSATGVLIGSCPFKNTGAWQAWTDAWCPVDNSQAGVRDVYLVFQGDKAKALVNLRSLVFLKSIPAESAAIPLGFSNRVDVADAEPQATNAWGMPEAGFVDDFESGNLKQWKNSGLRISKKAMAGKYSAESPGKELNYAFTPGAYINKTDTGGDWRTQAEAELTAGVMIDEPAARPGIGFASKQGDQRVYVTLNAEHNSIEAWRKLSAGDPVLIREFTDTTNAASPGWKIQAGEKYTLKLDWSPYSDGLIVCLQDKAGQTLTSFRTVIDLPAARYPLMICSGGAAHFDNFKFDPTLDDWDFKWQWKKAPVLASDVCNPAIWKGKNGKYYMMWRKFGADNYHGIVSSTDGINWTRVKDEVLKCTGDMNCVVDPFGDGLVYITPGGANLPWWTSDGTNDYTVWKKNGLNLGDIFGNSRIQEIVDTQKYRQMQAVEFQGNHYRFIAFCENWLTYPKPHTVILLSNTLTNWTLANPDPVIPPGTNFWGEKGNAIGSALVLPDGNILIASCSCTFAGYTGAPEPSNVSAIVDGRQPWKLLKLGVLPDAPVSREHVWYEGPNFGTALYYEPANDTLFFYGGFHDYFIGMMRAEHFSKSKLFNSLPAAQRAGSEPVDAHSK